MKVEWDLNLVESSFTGYPAAAICIRRLQTTPPNTQSAN